MVHLGCILIISAIFFGDLQVKNRIEKDEMDDVQHSILGGRILIRKHHNKGFVLNWGQNRRRMVAVLSVLLSVLMTAVFLFSLGHRGKHLMHVGLSLLLGGAFSNTYDRLKRQYVVDYFSFNVKWERLQRVVFNLSDFCIMIGALLIVIGTI